MSKLDSIRNEVVSNGGDWDEFILSNQNELLQILLGSTQVGFDTEDDVLIDTAQTNLILNDTSLISLDSLETNEIYIEKFAGGANSETSLIWNRNCTVSRTSQGNWSVVFDEAHTDNINYNISLSIEESSVDRDIPKISIIENSKTNLGFNIQITVDDNSSTADILSDQRWSFGVYDKISVVVNS